MDCGDASHAPVGTSRIAAHPRIALVARGSGGSSVGCGRARLFGRLHGIAHGDDVDHWNPWTTPIGLVETNAADSGLGRHRVRHLAHQFWAQQHPLARRRLSYPGWPPGPGGLGPLWRLSLTARFG